jgi:succinyl-CoA synthetase beta subunit
MIHDLEALPLFDGHRGGPPDDREAIAEALVTAGNLLVERESISELEVNPLLVRANDAVALDTLVSSKMTADTR